MKLPLSWLHEFVQPDLTTPELATRLAMTGTEVDRIERHGVGAVEFFVVGKVLEAVQHPDADRLRVCQVDVGDGGEPRTIVCGAPNVAAGQTVAVARPGSVMPDGTKLKKAKLRGVPSDGMILAEDEVGLGDDHAGIMVLDDAIPAGTPLRDVLPITDEVLELEVTPNRPDCLGVYGIAREVHAATGARLAEEPWADDPHPQGDEVPFDVRVEVDARHCPRLTARLFEGVRIGPSPRWLKHRLLAAGQRPINNVVDITNYVMFLTGQPLHAWDADLVEGTLVVRHAAPGETLVTLDDVERTLDPSVVVFADDGGTQSIAGIMGGSRSEVHEGTTRVLMEVATWDGPNVTQTMAKLALRTEAGARFARGLAPEQTLDAQAIASRLMVELCGATPVGGTLDLGGWEDPEPEVIHLRDERVSGLLGAPVERRRSAEVLAALGFGVTLVGDGLEVSVPAFRRNDVRREADLVEEVARILGFDDLPATVQENRTGVPGGLSPQQRLQRRAEDALAGRGLREVVGWSFTEPRLLDRLRLPEDDPMRRVVRLENPMSEAQSILRPTILGSLLDVAGHNAARGQGDLAIFESGAVYRSYADSRLADEHHALAGLLRGRLAPAAWTGGAPAQAGFFSAKALVEAVFAALRVPLEVERATWPFLHPGRSARVLAAGEPVGWVGEVHPLVAQDWDLDGVVAAFAIDLGRVVARAPEVLLYTDLTSFPAVKRDLALVVPRDRTAAEVVAAVRAGGGAMLRDVEVFDVYEGAQAGADHRSIAMHLSFAAGDRTLTDEEVQERVAKILEKAAEQVGAVHRG